MHWLQKLWDISSAGTYDLKELAMILGEDPSSFYRGQDLTACDLRGQDLTDMDLTGCNLDKALIDNATKIPQVFDPRMPRILDYVEICITRNFNKLILDYADEASYRYPAWAFKALVEAGIAVHRRGRWGYYISIIESNRYFMELFDYRSRSSTLKKTLQIYGQQQKYISQEMQFGMEEKRFAVTMFVGLLARKIPATGNKDYSVLTPNSLVKRKLTGLVRPSP